MNTIKKYGETIRMIREQKGYTMKELAQEILSVSFLSKFERGESDITLGLFNKLAERLMITIEEFLFIHNDYEINNLEQFFIEAGSAYYNRDSKKIHHLKQIEMEKWKKHKIDSYYYSYLFLKVYALIVDNDDISTTKEDIDRLSDYLFRVERWGYYEMMLYSSTMLFLDTERVVQLSKITYEKCNRYKRWEKYNSIVVSILINTIIHLIGPVNWGNEKLKTFQQEAANFFSYLATMSIPEANLFERVQILQLKGIYEIKMGHIKQGKQKVEKAVQILKELDSHKIAFNIESYVKLIT
ncbi:helix-turn-helix domain-containing protein [Psychrobacillus sp. FSL W7-1457]|uniref:helix-turn-helix domain-containing protein n=1 Tax=Psychrobacillus sp. FSL W7-1457 TaxID=2954547 RepID=UPI00315A5BB7